MLLTMVDADGTAHRRFSNFSNYSSELRILYANDGGSAGIESDNYDLRVSGCGGKAQQDVYMSALQKERKV